MIKRTKELKELYFIAKEPIMEKSKYKSFLTNEEFKENYGKIMLISGLCHEISKQLKEDNEKGN